MIPSGGLPSTGFNRAASSSTTCGNGLYSGAVATSVSGTGLDLFANPAAAYCSFNYVQLASSGRTGSANPMYGLGFWNMDMRFGKNTSIMVKDRELKLGFSADFFNIFNHENFLTPTLNFTSPTTFGVITSTYTPPNRTNSARWIELGLRLDF